MPHISLHKGPERTNNLDCTGDAKILNSPELRGIYQGELHMGNETSQRKRCLLQAAKLEGWGHLSPFDTGHGAIGFRICPAEFQSYFGPLFPYYASIPPFWNGNVCSVLLYNLLFYFTGDYN